MLQSTTVLTRVIENTLVVCPTHPVHLIRCLGEIMSLIELVSED
jgi:hypothetical protein